MQKDIRNVLLSFGVIAVVLFSASDLYARNELKRTAFEMDDMERDYLNQVDTLIAEKEAFVLMYEAAIEQEPKKVIIATTSLDISVPVQVVQKTSVPTAPAPVVSSTVVTDLARQKAQLEAQQAADRQKAADAAASKAVAEAKAQALAKAKADAAAKAAVAAKKKSRKSRAS